MNKFCRWGGGNEKEPNSGDLTKNTSGMRKNSVYPPQFYSATQPSRLFFLPPPTSNELHFFSATSGFTRLSMKTKYVCRGLISIYVNFHNNPNKWSTNLHVKIRRWGKRKKSRLLNSNQIGSFSFSPHLQFFIFEVTVHFVRFWFFFLFPTYKFLPVILLTTLSDCFEFLHAD